RRQPDRVLPGARPARVRRARRAPRRARGGARAPDPRGPGRAAGPDAHGVGGLRAPRALEPPAPRAAGGGSVTLSAAPPSSERRPLRVLSFNEGSLGTYILGQSQLEAALRVGLEEEDPAVPLAASFAG